MPGPVAAGAHTEAAAAEARHELGAAAAGAGAGGEGGTSRRQNSFAESFDDFPGGGDDGDEIRCGPWSL